MVKNYFLKNRTNLFNSSWTYVLMINLMLVFALNLNAQTNMYTVSPYNDSLWIVDTTSLTPVSTAINLTVASGTVTGVNSLAVRPCTGEIFLAFKKSGVTNRVLGTVDPSTGIITEIGVMGNKISGICFGSQNHLYAVSGDGGSPAETLYKVNISTGALTFFVAYGGGNDGETIGFCPDDGYIYHWSGRDTDHRMEYTDTATGVTTIIPPTGYLYDEVFGVTYIGNGDFLTANLDQEFVVVNTSGFATLLTAGTAPNYYRGLGFPYTSPVITFATSDVSCNGFGNGVIDATIPGGGVSTGGVLISEVDPGTPDFIEITNTSGGPVDVTGMKVVVSSDYTTISNFNSTTWNLSGIMASGAVEYREDVTGTNYWGNNLFWSSGQKSWAVIFDSTGAIVDALFWGWDSTNISNFSITVGTVAVSNNGDWVGPGINATCASTNSFTRVGISDNNDGTDWSTVAKSKGTANTALTIPFPTTNAYSWSNGSTTNPISGLSPGVYTVTITDLQGCLISGSDTISEPAPLVGTAIIDSNAICVGALNGGASTTVSGGIMPYTYSWSNGDTTSFATGLGGGANSVFIMDSNGCTVNDTVIIDEIDAILPTVITQNISVNLNSSGTINVPWSQVDNGSFDNCAILSGSLSISSFDCSNIGANTVWLTLTDTKGNMDSASAVITVVDNLPPFAFASNLSLYLDASGMVSANANAANNSSFDNCQIDSFYLSQTIFDCSDKGNNQVWFYAMDASGNKDSVQINISVADTITPTIVCPNDTSFCEDVYTFSKPVGMDNCSPFVTQLSTHTSGTFYSPGSYVFNYKVTDPSGNSSTCSYTVISLERPVVDLGNDVSQGVGSSISIVAGTEPTDSYLWNDGSTNNTADFMLNSDTTIYVTVTASNGCLASDTLNFQVLLGILNGVSNSATIKVYPNPASDAFQVEIADWKADEITISVLAVDGKLIQTKSLLNVVDNQMIQFDSKKLSSGVYFIRITDGINSSVSKLIIQ